MLITIDHSMRMPLIAIRQLVPADYAALNTLLTLVACRKKWQKNNFEHNLPS